MMEAAMTPLIELLKGVPADARACYEIDPTKHQFIPYGRLCREAADEIERLQTMNDALNHETQNLLCIIELLKAERDALKADKEQLKVWLAAIADEKLVSAIDGPGHYHALPLIWDYGNGDLSGKPCEWCLMWIEIRAALQGKEAE